MGIDLIRGLQFSFQEETITIRERRSQGWTLEVSDTPTMIIGNETHQAVVNGEWDIENEMVLDIVPAPTGLF